MTRHFLKLCVLALTGWLGASGVWGADPANPAPDFKEVYDLLRANLPDATDAALNRAAVAGLVSQFPGKVVLVGGPAGGGTASPSGAMASSRSAVIENNVAYLRVGRVAASLGGELAAAGPALTASNKIAGAVLDLRFAGGEDYGAAREAAGLWADKKSRPFAGPLIVVVNNATRGAAETLAAALRTAGGVLILGSSTAGDATTFKEFVLKDGERLLVATARGKGNGQAIPADGLKPDIAMTVDADDERASWQNPYGKPAAGTNVTQTATNSFLPFVDRTSEADLVRQQQKDGKLISPLKPAGPTRNPVRKNNDDDGDNDGGLPARAAKAPRPMLRDPVLARAVDLVKGLAVVQGARP
jgi:hypothetical protein